jgi:hypothetical protein
MATKGGRRRSAAQPSGAVQGYSRELLEHVAAILVRTGHSPRRLAREFQEVCALLKEPTQAWDPRNLDYFADIPHVIAHWHADPRYLDGGGAPVALPLRGRGRSLSALIRGVLPNEDPAAVTETLLRMKALRRRGSAYVPRGRYFSYPGDIARIHGLAALLGMLKTVEHNVSRRRSSPKILERTAINPSFPVSALPAFHRRLKSLAAEFLWNVDGDMRRREGAGADRRRIRLGVGVFAFENPGLRGSQARGTAARRPPARTRATR